MKYSLALILASTFIGYIFSDTREEVYVTGSVIDKSNLLVANPIYSFNKIDSSNKVTNGITIAILKISKNAWIIIKNTSR